MNVRNSLKKKDSEKEWPCDLALLALGFTGPEKTLQNNLDLHLTNEETLKVKIITKHKSLQFLQQGTAEEVNP